MPGENATTTLSESVAADLRRRIAQGEWANGDRLPSEHALSEHYGVSRATIRTALQDLESRGMTVTRRGVGTFVTGQAEGVRADLRQLESLSATIGAHGRRAGVEYRSIAVRVPDERERRALQLEDGEEVLATERALTADGETVAFSNDTIPRRLLGADFSPTEVSGSLFELLEKNGVRAVSAVTEVHAVHDPVIGWGDRPKDPTYLLLSQLHFDRGGTPVALADTYFIEGRFQWGLVRHR
ncbi:MAG TPA: GntR family transcriptional regulator [Acidimicrobiia bacterium]|nr:GntR family transcriptional regulator [Acidimicrobiia bacterium]